MSGYDTDRISGYCTSYLKGVKVSYAGRPRCGILQKQDC